MSFLFFKNYDSLVITTLGLVIVLVSVVDYCVEHNVLVVFLTGFGVGWIMLGLFLCNYKELLEY